jgi:hypothetical protein
VLSGSLVVLERGDGLTADGDMGQESQGASLATVEGRGGGGGKPISSIIKSSYAGHQNRAHGSQGTRTIGIETKRATWQKVPILLTQGTHPSLDTYVAP